MTQKLVSILSHMGVGTTTDALTTVPVSAIHYSKNIPLTDGSTPYHYINKIKEANISLLLDVKQTDFRNEGHSFKWHCNSYEVVFYDKIRDLEKAKKSDKRSMEKDGAMQLHLFDQLYNRPRFEILRMEVRLGKRAKIKQLFKKLGINSDLTFADLFSSSIARAVLLHYLDEVERKRPPLLDFKAATEKGLLATMIINNPHLNPRTVMQLYRLKMALQHVSMRELRTMFGAHKTSAFVCPGIPARQTTSDRRTWHRLMADARNLNLPKTPNPFDVIRDCLNELAALRKDLLWQERPATTRSQMEVI